MGPVLLLLLCIGAVSGAPSTLFDDRDKVIILNKDTYKVGLYNGDKAHVFLLYSSWCGHCQRFAPTYIELAEHINNWFSIVDVTGVDCVYDVDVCRVFKVEGYPTLRFIPPTTNTSYIGITFSGDRNIPSMVQWIIEQLDSVRPRPSKWPNLSHLSSAEVTTLLEKGSRPPLVVIAAFDDIIAKQVILNFHGKVKLRYVLISTNAAEMLGSTEPGLIIVGNRGQVSHVTNIEPTVTELEMAIDNLPLMRNKEEGEEEAEEEEDDSKKKIRYVNTNLQYKLHELDLQSAVNNAFYTEVGLKTVFSAKDLENLKNFLVAINRCGSWSPSYKKHISAVKKSVKDLTTLDNKQWAAILASAAEQGYPRNSTWIGCQGSTANTRGYTCSMWLLFHTMLSSCFNIKPGSLSVLKSIHGYIDSFFTCSHCRSHFLDMADKMKLLQVENDKFAVLALWEAHNKVNKRLSTVVHDPYFPKIQYPPEKICNDCKDKDGTFDTEIVFKFMLSHYRKVLTPYGRIRVVTGKRRRQKNG